jgi:hypothetical protein
MKSHKEQIMKTITNISPITQLIQLPSKHYIFIHQNQLLSLSPLKIKHYTFYYTKLNNQYTLIYLQNHYKTISNPITLLNPFQTFQTLSQLENYIKSKF